MEGSPAQGLLVIERILRDRDSIWRQIIEERDLRGLTGQMLASSAVSLALYGAVLGASNGWVQALASTVKLPLLFLATLSICLPTLYLFNLVFGARLSMMQAVTLILVSITVTSVLTLAFAPISLFFLISAHSYEFFKLLNVCILALTAIVGLRFLTVGMRTLNQHQANAAEAAARRPAPVAVVPPQPAPVEPAPVQPALVPAGTAPALVPPGGPVAPVTLVPPGGSVPVGAPAPGGAAVAAGQPNSGWVHGAPILADPRLTPPRPQPAPAAPVRTDRPNSMTLLYIWILLFGFVGTQLAWTLRPFFGSPDQPFSLFRHISGTFYSDIFATIGHLLHG
jgi:hypothetical protein